MLVDLIDYIDINNADATSEGDKDWIFDQIRTGFASNGGVAGLNKLVTDVVATAKILDSDPILESAICGGDAVALEFIRRQPELYIMNMYRCGFSSLLSKMMNVNESSMIQVSTSNRLKDPVEVYAISYDGTSLNYEFTVEKRKSTKYSMAEGSFWIARKLGDDSDVGVYIANKATKRMFRHADFMRVICGNFSYWKKESVLTASVKRFQHFFALKKEQLKSSTRKSKDLVPTIDIELVWQTFLSLPNHYERFCKVYTTGSVIHHNYDSLWYNLRDNRTFELKKCYAKTCLLWSEHYHESYATAQPDYIAWQRHHFLKHLFP
eukprot:gene20387-21001_t